MAMSPVENQPSLIAASVASGRFQYPFMTLGPLTSSSPGLPPVTSLPFSSTRRTCTPSIGVPIDPGRRSASGWLNVTAGDVSERPYPSRMIASNVFSKSLRTATGSAAPPVAVLNDFEKTFDAIILEGYGLSETSPAVTFNHPDAERRPGSIGTPIEGVRVRLVDENRNEVPTGSLGEIEVKGPNVMKGYWNLPDATDAAIADGWFSTGDIAVVDDDGYYYVVDRKKDLIIRGGYNVYPREIEEVLHEHPAVAQVAVIGIAHDSLGEEVGAAVVLKAGIAAVAEELRQFVKARVAAYKYPRRIWFVESLPTGPTGKLLRREVIPPPTEEA